MKEASVHGKALAKRKVGRSGPDAATWDALVRAFAENARSLNRVAHDVGVSWVTAKKAYDVGWPDQGLSPISEILAQRGAAGLALAHASKSFPWREPTEREHEAEAVVRAALPAALYQVAEESRVLEACRQFAVKLASTVGQMAESCDKICAAALDRLVEDIEEGKVSAVDAMRIVAMTATMGKTVTDLIGELMKLHRLALAQPGEIIGHRVFSSPEEALAVIDRGTRAARRARELGLVSLPGGGADGAEPGEGI